MGPKDCNDVDDAGSMVDDDRSLSEDSSYERSTRTVNVNDGGELVEVPFLKKGFPFKKYVTTVTKADKWIAVEENYIPTSTGITDKYVKARCQFLGLELTQENKKNIKDIMGSHQNAMRTTLKEWLQRYWVELCRPLGITYSDSRQSGRAVTSFSEFQSAVRQCKSDDEKRKLAICLYVSFDFTDNFRRRIGKALMREHSFQIDHTAVVEDNNESELGGNKKPRRKKDCFERLVSQILNDQRKNINKMAEKTCKYSFTNTRHNGVLNKKNERQFRRKKYYYPWMVLGDGVSTSNHG